MKHWIVISGVIEDKIPILDDGSGPIEQWREVVYAEAVTKRDAIAVGVRVMSEWPNYSRQDGINPFAEVTAEPAECPHGFCWCELEDCDRGHQRNGHGDYCEECIREHDEAEELTA